ATEGLRAAATVATWSPSSPSRCRTRAIGVADQSGAGRFSSPPRGGLLGLIVGSFFFFSGSGSGLGAGVLFFLVPPELFFLAGSGAGSGSGVGSGVGAGSGAASSGLGGSAGGVSVGAAAAPSAGAAAPSTGAV